MSTVTSRTLRFPTTSIALRRLLFFVCLGCLTMLAFGLYLQHVVGLEPCPMCIVQRYALTGIAFVAGLTALTQRKALLTTGFVTLLLAASFGAFVAARQSWLQLYPPEIASCGRGFYSMIETFPLKRVVPMIFKGSGDCTKVDWTFLSLSIANWSFMCFTLIVVVALIVVVRSDSAPNGRM